MSQRSSASPRSPVIQTLLTVFALLAALGALWRMFDERATKRVDDVTLQYLAVAGALLLLREVKSLAFGNYKVEFERKLEELENKVENAQAAAVGGRYDPTREEMVAAAPGNSDSARPTARFTPTPGAVADDPWKGVFEGQSVSGTRELSAEVSPIGTPGLFRVRLQVASTNPKRDPLRGSVQFFLHPTFGNDRPVVTVGPSGIAELSLTAWGAFTVGALADDGRTKLELDLSQLPSAPSRFKNN